MRWVIALVLLALVAAQDNYQPCTISGDPHFYTFNSPAHDFQGSGVFEILNHQQLEVQSQFAPCNGQTVTCTRATTINFKDGREGQPIIVKFGWWSQGGYDDVYVEGHTYKYNDQVLAQGIQLSNKYNVKMSGGRLSITPPVINGKQRQGWSISLGAYYVMIAAPVGDPEFDRTACGLCGDMFGDPSTTFRDANGYINPSFANLKPGTRRNGKDVNAWASSYVVNATSKFKPIMLSFHHYNPTTQSYHVSSEIPQAVIPQVLNDDNDPLQQIQFQTADQMQAAKDLCEKASAAITDPIQKQAQYINCMFDHARFGDAQMSVSSPNSALTAQALNQQDSSSSGTSSGAVAAAVICSILAAAGIGAAIFYFFRSRRLQEDLTKALVPINQPLNTLGARDGQINLTVANGI